MIQLAHTEECPDAGENYCNYCCIHIEKIEAKYAALVALANRMNLTAKQVMNVELVKDAAAALEELPSVLAALEEHE